MISFFVPGIPVPQGSKRQVPLGGVHGGRSIMINANDKKLRPWRATVSDCALAEMIGRERIHGPVVLELVLRFPRPSGHFSKSKKNAGQLLPSAEPVPGVKPDMDKCFRAIGDSLAGIVFGDDSRIVDGHVFKRYALERGPGAEITVRAWAPGDGPP